MIIWSEFHMCQHRDDYHREDALHFRIYITIVVGSNIDYDPLHQDEESEGIQFREIHLTIIGICRQLWYRRLHQIRIIPHQRWLQPIGLLQMEVLPDIQPIHMLLGRIESNVQQI